MISDYTKSRVIAESTGNKRVGLASLARRYDLSQGQVAEILESAKNEVHTGLPAQPNTPWAKVFHNQLPHREAAWLVQHLDDKEQYWLARVMSEAGALAGHQLAAHLLGKKGVAPGPGYRCAPQQAVSTLDRLLGVILPPLLQHAPATGLSAAAQGNVRSPCGRPEPALD